MRLANALFLVGSRPTSIRCRCLHSLCRGKATIEPPPTKGVVMSNEVQEGNISFIDFPASSSTPSATPASIATFPLPAGSPRARTAHSAKSVDSGELIGESPEMVEVSAQLRRVASSQATVMLVGESGTGKELAAEFLHAHSPQANGPIVAVNCG